MIRVFVVSCLLLFFGSVHGVAEEAKSDANLNSNSLNLENFLYLDTKYGRSIIVLYPKEAPKHVERVKKLVREGFYDGLLFHRVIHGFMAQTGDPTGTGTGSSEYPNLRAEFNRIPYNRGVVGAARAQNPHSANSQFFITFQSAHFLNVNIPFGGKWCMAWNI